MTTQEQMTLAQQLAKLGACQEAVEWVGEQGDLSPQELWDKCKRGDWMLWICGKLSGPPESDGRKKLVKASCDCARLALKYVAKDENRPRICIETAEAWADGKATIEQVRKARSPVAYASADAAAYAYAADAAYAAAAAAYAYAAADAADAAAADAADAYAAAYAAYAAYASRSKMLSNCADIVRKHYPTSPEL